MTLNYTSPSADTRFTPRVADDARSATLSQADVYTGDAAEETIVPVYARKAPRKSNKMLLMVAAPVVVAGIALGAWALTGEGSRDDAAAVPAEETQVAAAETQTTSRLMANDTAAADGLVSESAAPVEAAAPVPAATPAPVTRAATPAPRATPAPARRAAPAAPTRSAAPAPAAAPIAATPITPMPYEPTTVTPVAPAAAAPAPTVQAPAAPVVVAPTPSAPAEPVVTPPQPGGAV